MTRRILLAGLWPAAAAFAQGRKSAPSIFGRNLLANASGETEMRDNGAIPGWGDPQEGFATDEYGHTSGEWDWGLSGCPGCGKRYFRLAWDGEVQQKSATQIVDVTPAAASIDAGNVTAELSGYVGAIIGSDTAAQLVAVFTDTGGKELSQMQTPAADTNKLPKPPAGEASLTVLKISGAVPAGTRKVQVRLLAKGGGSGSYLAVADNLSFQLIEKK